MSDRVPYIATTEIVKGVRRWGEEHGFKYGDETWTFIRQGDADIAIFEQPGSEDVARKACEFLNALPEAEAKAFLEATGGAAIDSYLSRMRRRRIPGSHHDGLPERGVARL